MIRSLERRGVAAWAMALVLIVGCQPGPTPSLTPTQLPTPRPTPTAVPTPVPTPIASPTEGAVEPAELLIRVTLCTEICVPTPGTTVLADGRMIWELSGQVVEARLTEAALERIRDEVAARDELREDGDYQAELRPGAQPFPRGTSSYRFEIGPGEPTIVTSGEPADYAAEPRLWIIPPEMERLARLARQLLEPLAWLGQDELARPPAPYEPSRYWMLIELYPGIGELPGFGIDVEAVASPFGVPLEAAGQPVPGADDGFPVRCLVTDADTARRLATAEIEAGSPRNPAAWSSTIAYDWRRGGGFVQVSLTQVLPHEVDPCGDLDLEAGA
jgi:hypothetical protein